MMSKLFVRSTLLAAALGASSLAHGYEFRMRFTVWNGVSFVPVVGDTITGVPGTPQRVRLEIGVFDDADGPAPAGGLVGWNIGTIEARGGGNSRTPGRLVPFDLPGPGNGLPSTNPFTCLTGIETIYGTQSPAWGCAGGVPIPQPPALIRGRNTYVACYEITTTPNQFSYSIVVGGNMLGATGWNVIGSPTPPNCATGDPGSVTYAPVPTAPRPINRTLRVNVGAEMRTRFARWNGSAFVPLCDDTLYATPGSTHRIRFQAGVFDSNGAAAPAGGFVGWNNGTLTTTGGTNTRTPGRVGPFMFPGPGNGDPAANPFTALTNISATLGTQSPAWNCQPDGTPPPAPSPLVRALNSYIDVYEITTVAGAASYRLTYAGDFIAATNWLPVGVPTPPDCGVPANPADDVPGAITYAPVATPPEPGCRTLRVQVGSGPVDCLGDGVPDSCQTAFTERLYSLTGTSAGTPWSWCINSPAFSSICNLSVPGVPAGQPALAVATAFANSINAAPCPDTQLFAQARVVFGTTYLVVSIASQVTGDTPFDLCVGPNGGPGSACCPAMAFSSCAFNPTMTRIPTAGTDCNANGRDDTIDILLGNSADNNNDGIPDDCQPCPADFNNDGIASSQDFFDFLGAFFSGAPNADFDRNGTVNSQDFFEFIAAFFAGC